MLAASGGLIAAGIVLNLVIGALVGLVPFLMGKMRGRFTLGLVGLILCIAVAPFLSFLASIVLALLFTIAVWASSRGRTTAVAA